MGFGTIIAASSLVTIDWLMIILYFLIILALAFNVIRKSKDTSDDYFLAGRHLGWFVIGASIFASNIGSEHLVGLAGSGTTDGVGMAHYELHAWCLLVLGWVFVPFFMRSKVFTMPEFLEKRFSPTARWVLSIISLVAYVITKIAVGIFAGGIVFSTLLPELNIFGLDSFWIGSVLVILFTGLYTVLGGLRAVAYTEALQTIILVIGSALVMFYGLHALGGWSELREICGSQFFDLWRPLVPEGVQGTWSPVLETNEAGQIIKQAWYFEGASKYPWLGMLFCAPIIGLWYWCTDQYIVQRTLGAPNEQQARRGSICASFFKLLPVFIFIIPGMICFALMQKIQAGDITNMDFSSMYDKDGTLVGNRAFPLMVMNVLPAGVRGIVVAGLLAALMSSLAGVFNASATLFTMDFYRKLRPTISEHNLVKIGRIATGVMIVIGLMWIPVIKGSKGLYDYLQSVQGYLAPPIFVVFFLGVFWKRLNAKGCLASMVTGFALGVFRLAVDTPVKMEWWKYDKGSFFWIINNIYFQYYSLFIFVVCIVVMIAVSLLTNKPAYEKISGLTYGTVSDEHRLESRKSWDKKDVIFSVLVCLAILAAYLYFTG